LKLKDAKLVLVCSLLLINISWAKADVDTQELAEQTIIAIDLCIHWGGEERFSEERAVQIEEGIERDCADARRCYVLKEAPLRLRGGPR